MQEIVFERARPGQIPEIFDLYRAATQALQEAGIALYGGVQGAADAAVEAFLAGSLHFDPNAACNHHHEGGEHHCHGEGAHTCGHHGGEHHCRHGQC